MTRDLVLLHGFLGEAHDFDELAAHLRGWRCHAVDLPGHGAAAPLAADVGFRAGVEVVSAAIDSLRLARPHLLGYSMGGRIALALALRDPYRFASIVTIGMHPGIEDEADRAARLASDRGLAHALRRDGLQAFLERWYRQPLFATLRARPGFGHFVKRRASGDPDALAGALTTFSTGCQPPIREALTATAIPLLLLAGAEDSRYVERNAALARQAPHLRHATVPAAGHAAHLEQPAATAGIVADFLNTQQEQKA